MTQFCHPTISSPDPTIQVAKLWTPQTPRKVVIIANGFLLDRDLLREFSIAKVPVPLCSLIVRRTSEDVAAGNTSALTCHSTTQAALFDHRQEW